MNEMQFYNENKISFILDFVLVILEVKRRQENIFKVGRDFEYVFLYRGKLLFK